MNLLIVGARGMLGTALSRVFRDFDPTNWDRGELDIVDEDAVREKVGQEKPDVIINAAAYTDVDGAEKEREVAMAVNEAGVRNLALIARDISATLVHYSTDYVFPGDKKDGYAEDDTPGPATNAYGESKLAGEQALREISPQFYLLRCAWLYGPAGDSSDRDSAGAKKNFVDIMLEAAQSKRKLSVVDDQWGSPTFTNDVAGATREILMNNYPLGVYHAVNRGVTTWFGFAKEIFRLAGVTIDLRPVTSAEFPRPAKRPTYSVLKNTRGPSMRRWQHALDEYIHSM